MATTKDISWDDSVLPFQLENSGVRGRVTRVGPLLEHILSRHDYPVAVSAMVAELVTLTALIGPTIKLRWKLSLQVRGNGAIRTIATDYYAPETEGGPARIRAWASFDADRLTEAPAFDQIGQGYFAVLIDQGEGTTPYQGLTPLSGGSLSSCAQTYFEQSEQLPTQFQLTVGRSRLAGQADEHWRAGGIMLQTLPAQSHDAPDSGQSLESADILQGAQSEDWNRSTILMSTVEAIELIDAALPLPKLLVRLFHEEEPVAFGRQGLHFGCSCSPDRVRSTLAIYSAKDITHMTNDAGIVTADCQFCGAHYEFDPKSLGFEASVDAQGNLLPPAQASQ